MGGPGVAICTERAPGKMSLCGLVLRVFLFARPTTS